MSTRATYKIKEVGVDYTYIQTFYIHYDGYPEGAAIYFEEFISNMEKLKVIREGHHYWKEGKSIVAFGMIDLSEFTEDHDVHGDTEYQYNIYINLVAKKWLVEARKKYEAPFFDGTMQEFITKYKETECQH